MALEPSPESIRETIESAIPSPIQEVGDGRVTAIEDKLAALETLLEGGDLRAKSYRLMSDYVEVLLREQRFMAGARWGVAGFSVLALLLIATVLAAAVFRPESPLLKAPPITAAVFVVGCISGVVVLISGFARSVFKSAGERHSENFTPPQLETALKLLEAIKG